MYVNLGFHANPQGTLRIGELGRSGQELGGFNPQRPDNSRPGFTQAIYSKKYRLSLIRLNNTDHFGEDRYIDEYRYGIGYFSV